MAQITVNRKRVSISHIRDLFLPTSCLQPPDVTEFNSMAEESLSDVDLTPLGKLQSSLKDLFCIE